MTSIVPTLLANAPCVLPDQPTKRSPTSNRGGLLVADSQLRTDLLDPTDRALRVSGHADLPTVVDEAMREIDPFLARE